MSGHQPNFRASRENGHSIFSLTCRKRGLTREYFHYPAMISGRFTTFSYQKLITPRCFSIVDVCNMNTILFSHALPCQLDCALYQNFCSLLRMWVPAHTPIHNEDFNRIPRCLATSPLSGIGKYANDYVVTTFRIFSFEHTL